MRPIQVVVTQDAQGRISCSASEASPLELVGLLAIAQADLLVAMRAPEPPGVEVVTGPAAEAIARDARAKDGR